MKNLISQEIDNLIGTTERLKMENNRRQRVGEREKRDAQVRERKEKEKERDRSM